MSSTKPTKSTSQKRKRSEEGELPEEVPVPTPVQKADKAEKTTKKRPMVVTIPSAAERELLERARKGDFTTHTALKCQCIITGADGMEKLCQKNARRGGTVFCGEHDSGYQQELVELAQGRVKKMRHGATTQYADGGYVGGLYEELQETMERVPKERAPTHLDGM